MRPGLAFVPHGATRLLACLVRVGGDSRARSSCRPLRAARSAEMLQRPSHPATNAAAPPPMARMRTSPSPPSSLSPALPPTQVQAAGVSLLMARMTAASGVARTRRRGARCALSTMGVIVDPASSAARCAPRRTDGRVVWAHATLTPTPTRCRRSISRNVRGTHHRDQPAVLAAELLAVRLTCVPSRPTARTRPR